VWLRTKLCNKYILLGSFTIVALLGSAIGAIAFDYDHIIAWLLGKDGRFLHHPTAILCCVLLVVLSWWIVKLLYRLYRGVNYESIKTNSH